MLQVLPRYIQTLDHTMLSYRIRSNQQFSATVDHLPFTAVHTEIKPQFILDASFLHRNRDARKISSSTALRAFLNKYSLRRVVLY